MEEDSSRKPRSKRFNQLLRQVYELEVLEREIKRTNAVLTKKNTQWNNSLLEMKGMYFLLQKKESEVYEGQHQALQDDQTFEVADEEFQLKP